MVPAILGLLFALVLVLGYTFMGTDSTPAGQHAPSPPGEYWRCVACVKAPQKAWAACQTVTGIGDELGAKNRAREKACNEAAVPLPACKVEKMNCRKLRETEIHRIRSAVRLEEVPAEQ